MLSIKLLGSQAVFKFCLDNKIKLIYSATSTIEIIMIKLSPYAFTKSKNLELLENLKSGCSNLKLCFL